MVDLKKLADLTSSDLIGDPDIIISGVNTLDEASKNEASFLANTRYLDSMLNSKAGVICVDKNAPLIENKNYLVSEDSSNTFQEIINFFSKEKKLSGFLSIHENVTIHKSAKIGKNVVILPNSVIDENVVIDDNSFIGSSVYIGPNSSIGKNSILHSNITIREGSIIKDRVIIQSGAVIGSCGFGYLHQKDGSFKKLEQVGIVIIEDDVEIGANTCIDRARFKATIIKKGTKIDNLVQIAHNVEIGKNTAIAAQSGIAGSSKVGDFVIMGGQVGVTGHVEIESFVQLATRSGVSKKLKKGKYRGSPAIALNEYNRQYVTYKNLSKTLKKLEDKLSILEEKTKNL
ncbi:MAG: UDP-3-O-acylglucosamine N-acyltransferase [Candidatus Anoxychlamydiales bacterium]|nr:UDP-3-O-acylglucosamine N-acyltransferase [Candidatus Anoxychlamydiales bacterium]